MQIIDKEVDWFFKKIKFKYQININFQLLETRVNNQSFRSDTFYSYTTNTYKLHYFESGAGIRFVLTTDPNVGNMQRELSKIYCEYYVEYVIKNPLYQLQEEIKCSLFQNAVESFISGLTNFKSGF